MATEISKLKPCIHCGRPTNNEDGVCDHCRRDIGNKQYCFACRLRTTTDASGMCNKCREPYEACVSDSIKLEEAIERESKTLVILESRADPKHRKPFSRIAKELGLTTSVVMNLFSTAIINKGAGLSEDPQTWLEKNGDFQLWQKNY